jgi:hypothetical protein
MPGSFGDQRRDLRIGPPVAATRNRRAVAGPGCDDATAKLVALEHDGKTEIVIHANKLKEVWDVTNLYTIVPLRASASDILTEQTLGRGIRLLYASATGEDATDTLAVIAHDRFHEVIEKAKEPGSLVMKILGERRGGHVWRDARLISRPRPSPNPSSQPSQASPKARAWPIRRLPWPSTSRKRRPPWR